MMAWLGACLVLVSLVNTIQAAHVKMQAHKKGICTVAGDPYFFTFDREKPYVFNGTGCHTLLQQEMNGAPLWKILGMFKEAPTGSYASYMVSAHAYYNGHLIKVSDNGEVKIDNIVKELNVPIKIEAGATGYFEIKRDGPRGISFTIEPFKIEAYFDLRKDGRHEALIDVTKSSYKGSFRGLCGDADGDLRNDYVNQGTRQVIADTDTFGNSWKDMYCHTTSDVIEEINKGDSA